MDKVKTEIQYFLTYDLIFEDNERFDPFSLTFLPQKNAIALVANLLHRFNVRTKQDIHFQFNILRSLLLECSQGLQERVRSFFNEHTGLQNEPGLKFLDRRPMLNLLEYLLVYSDKTSELPLNSAHIDTLFKSILLLGQEESRLEENQINGNGTTSIHNFADQVLLSQFRFIEIDRLKDYKTQLLKVYYFFKFCSSNQKYNEQLSKFLHSRGLSSYRSYLWKIFSLSLELIEEGEFREILFAPQGSELAYFLQQYIINEKQVEINANFRSIRSYPFFRLAKNHYMLLNYNFFVDKFYHGFLFDFATAAELQFGNLRNDMGRLFSEPVMFYQVMQNCFEHYGDVRLNGAELNRLLSSSEPDYYIRIGQDIFLFEFKDIIMNASTKNTTNPNLIKAEIFKKLEESDRGRPKGISQLLNSVKSISEGIYNDFKVDSFEVDLVTIYPIIVHSDVVLESHGVNYIISNRFRDRLEQMQVKKATIKNVVLINVDTLIQMQDHFNTGKINLKESIDSYFEYIDTDQVATATYPFDEFLKYYFVKKNNEDIGVPKELRIVTNTLQEESLRNYGYK